ncbi:MAG: MarR family winged helix-turn-helix transcriptional regulator [Candidatus Helarchaeota archaeon]
MITKKGLVLVAHESKMCADFLNKNHLTLISLIGEDDGLRVTDIHRIVQGNKSWISNILSKLENQGLVSRKKNGREVFYKLTEKGKKLSELAAAMLEKLLIQENIVYKKANSYWIYKYEIPSKKLSDFIGIPLHEYKGELFVTKSHHIFIGKSITNKRLEILKIKNIDIKDNITNYDDSYKRRFAVWQKPTKISFSSHGKNKTVYYFRNYPKGTILLPSAISYHKNKEIDEFLIKNIGG